MKLHRLLSNILGAALLSAATTASAFPGFYAGKGKVPVSKTTHVIVMNKGETNVVTVMGDYKGDLKGFAIVMPVPGDVTLEQVKGMRRDFVDRIDQISAPRFHEFWEKHPCDPGDAEQIWQMDRKAKASTAFLSSGMMMGAEGAKRKVPKEMLLTVDPDFKEGEHTFHVLTQEEGADDVVGFLEGKGYKAPEGAAAKLKPYVDKGMNVIVAEIDEKRIELVSSSRAILSPIRYSTNQPVTINSTLGLLNHDEDQELFVYVIHPERRFEVKNYKNVYPPTNVRVDFKVKERVGEFYAGIHDLMLKKDPNAFLVEYAWPTTGNCGEPCPNEKLMIHELLTLGGDVFEEAVPEEEAHPEPPEMTEEEEEKFDEIEDKEEKKRIKADRIELARRKALLERHKYVLSRMHHRYQKNGLPKDVVIGPAPHVRGGIELPKGPAGDLPQEVKPAKESKLQVRYTFLHPNKAVLKCEKPVRHRWGKPPRTYRGLRKIWVAQDMAFKSRTSHKPAELVKVDVPALGLTAVAAPKKDAGAAGDAGAEGEGEKKGNCGCAVPGRRVPVDQTAWLLGALLAAFGLRRRR